MSRLSRWLAALSGRLPANSAATTPVVQQFHPGLDASQANSLPRVDCIDPALLPLEAGQTYLWCRCGRSRRQPFCDGSHAGSGLEPLAFVPARSQIFWLCNCKYTRQPPFCDAAHNRLEELFGEAVKKRNAEKQKAGH